MARHTVDSRDYRVLVLLSAAVPPLEQLTCNPYPSAGLQIVNRLRNPLISSFRQKELVDGVLQQTRDDNAKYTGPGSWRCSALSVFVSLFLSLLLCLLFSLLRIPASVVPLLFSLYFFFFSFLFSFIPCLLFYTFLSIALPKHITEPTSLFRYYICVPLHYPSSGFLPAQYKRFRRHLKRRWLWSPDLLPFPLTMPAPHADNDVLPSTVYRRHLS
jgi:hypothetical protein